AVLHLADEHVYLVPPLPVADDPAAALAPASALFRTRAQQAAPDFQISPGNRGDVAAICARLDGLPLAIELAAARMRVLTPRALLARLSHRFALLVGGPRDRPERQQTLRATLDWSYALLDPTEQRLLRRLAVFAGGFSLELAEQLVSVPDVIPLLERLVAQSLVQRVHGQSDALRFTLLETIRAYALERLVELGEEPAARQSHARCLLAFAERAAPELEHNEQATWLDRLELEQDNLRAALAWAQAHAVEAALRLVAALGAFWIKRGSLSEGRAWAEGVLTAAGWRREQGATPATATAPLAGALAALGQVLFHQGAYAAATPLLTAAAAQFEQLGRPHDAVLACYLLVPALAIQGDGAAAAARAATNLPLLTGIDDPPARVIIARYHGLRAMHQGDDALAQRYLEQACAELRAAGMVGALAIDLLHLGTTLLHRDDERAATCFREARALAVALKDRSVEGMALHNLGELARVRGEYPAAAAHYRASLRMLQDTDRRSDVSRLLHNLGYVALHSGDTPSALEHFQHSLALYYPHDPRGVTEALDGFAAVAAVRGDPLTAARFWGAAEVARA
ncbi:MAG: tetratricopeptide repeat protein, partial [Chloroflexales bacterium]|nr:tetratricopeptide repeat protein [Chloroflexales bacterium]